MNKGLVIFDLDGTLSVSHHSIVESVKRTLKELGQAPQTEEFILSLIGEQTIPFFRQLMPDFEDIEYAAKVYVGIEREVIKTTSELYPRVPEMLDRLKELGCKLVLCSNGSVEYETFITKTAGIFDKFDYLISGSDYRSKAEAVAVAMRKYDCKVKIMVGDRKHDIEAGIENGIVSVAALYGYVREGELDKATYFINEPIELIDIVEGLLDETNV